MEKERTIVWSEIALDQIENALRWISNDSFTEAEKVELAVLKKMEAASRNPQQFPPDKYKKENEGNFRAFEIYSLRISYSYRDDHIRILQVRHVKQKPRFY